MPVSAISVFASFCTIPLFGCQSDSSHASDFRGFEPEHIVTDLIKRTYAVESAFKSDARNREVRILKHRKRLMYAVKVKHFFETHIHMSVKGA